MKRIEPQEVVNAFKELGMKAKQNSYMTISYDRETSWTPCACGLGGVYLQRNNLSPDEVQTLLENDYLTDDINTFFDIDYTKNYRLGFVRGFDNSSFSFHPIDTTPEYIQGYEDGKQARLQLLAEDLLIERVAK